MRRIKIILLFLLCSGRSFGQNNSIRFDHITPKDGLPHSIVWTIFQDNKGFIWFGTNNGLARYDGYNFKVYQPDPDNPNTLSHKGVIGIFADKQNRLWLILQSNGINYFNPSTEKFEHFFYNPTNPRSISWSSINCYLCDSKNNIWLGTVHVLNRYNPVQKGFDKYYSNIDSIQALENVKNNNIDLILMDLKMPVMDGIEATRLIKQIKSAQLIVAQPAFAYKEEKAEFLKSGFDGYIVKPIVIEKLMEIINEVFCR